MRQTRNYRIPTKDINTWTKAQDLPPEDRSLILYIHDHAKENNLSLDSLALLLKKPGTNSPYSADSVWQALTGRRNHSALSNFLESVAAFKLLNDERKTLTRAPFIETNLTKKIFSICDTARLFNSAQFIIGESHIGKTTALEEYTRQNNHGRTVFLRIPAGGSLVKTTHRLCSQLHFPIGGSNYMKTEQIIKHFDDQMVLIVDEAHHMLTSGKRSLVTLEFLREIHDVSKCGLVISATPAWDKAREDRDLAPILAQLENRHLITSRLPSKPTKANLNSFAKSFGLKPATDEALDLQSHVIETTSLGRWLKIMQGASRIASKSGETLTWDHVLKCNATLLELAGK